MCVAFLFIANTPRAPGQHAEDPAAVVNPYSFVLAVNRDEQYAR
jgi:hypothetical protein